MKLFAIYITNNIIQQCGRTTRQACRPTVLFVWLGNPTTYSSITPFKYLDAIDDAYYFSDLDYLNSIIKAIRFF